MRRFLSVLWLLCTASVLIGIAISFFLGGTAPIFEYFSLIPQSFYVVCSFIALFFGFFLFRFRRQWLLALPIIGIILSFVWLLDFVPYHFTSSPRTDSSPIKVVSWNTRVWDSLREDGLFQQLKSKDADVYLLQEVVFSRNPGLENRLAAVFPGYHFAYSGEFLTISRYPIISSSFPISGGYSRHIIDVSGKTISFYNVHLRVPIFGDRLRQDNIYDFRTRRGQFTDLQQDLFKDTAAVFLGGDFNSTRNYSFIRILEKQLQMNQPNGVLLFPKTYHSQLPIIRIDYQFTNKSNVFVKYERIGGTISDHSGLYGEFYANN
jgi:endonuclease/exonuclease/phosphatase (EEP) superfamily protein YafD